MNQRTWSALPFALLGAFVSVGCAGEALDENGAPAQEDQAVHVEVGAEEAQPTCSWLEGYGWDCPGTEDPWGPDPFRDGDPWGDPWNPGGGGVGGGGEPTGGSKTMRATSWAWSSTLEGAQQSALADARRKVVQQCYDYGILLPTTPTNTSSQLGGCSVNEDPVNPWEKAVCNAEAFTTCVW